MLYKFNSDFINVEEISSVSSEPSSNPKYPFALRVYMKSGKNYGVCYSTEEARNSEAWNIMQAHNRCNPEPVTRYEVESIVSSQMDKCRRDFRRLREEIREVANHE